MFGFLPHNLYTNHVNQNTTGLSPRLWSQVSGSLMASDGDKRLVLSGDDFLCVHFSGDTDARVNTDLISEQPYYFFSDDLSNHSFSNAIDEKGGVLQLAQDAGGANEEISIEAGNAVGSLGTISTTSGDSHMMAFECRVKWNHITDGALTNGNIISAIGLLGPGSSGGNVLQDSASLTLANHGIGFTIPVDDGDTVDFFYEAASQTRVDALEDIKALTNNEFTKLGFIYDPDEVATKRIKVYVDNEEQGTYVTQTQIEAATFPDAETLQFCAAMKSVAGGDACEMSIDWWAFAQVLS